MKVFGVDFDGTLSFGQWPEARPPNRELIAFLQHRKQIGDKVILWTCREGEALDVAVSWCREQGLEFDAVNDNLPELIRKYGNNSRKISCDFYIDDRAMAGNLYRIMEEDEKMSTQEEFADRIKRIMGESIPDDIPRGTYDGRVYSHIFTEITSNFIDGRYPKLCSIKGNLTNTEIKYHVFAKHMNSSQVMCISYFKKFFEKNEYEKCLLVILSEAGIPIDQDEKINSAVFEYEPKSSEGTNFDFYLILTSGKRISFEIKYTEDEFGGASYDKNDPDKYNRKWNDVYQEMVQHSPFLSLDKEAFYKNYQVNRNIVYASPEDYVIFLTPKANDAKALREGRDYIDSLQNSHILNIYWEDVARITQNAVEGYEELKDYYLKFYRKYIEILK